MAGGIQVQVTRKNEGGAAKLVDRLTKLLDKPPKIAVGLPRDSTPYPDGTSVIMVGFWNEFGTENIPERPFLRTTANQKREEWLKLAKDIYTRAIKKNKNPTDFMSLLGERMENDIKAGIDSGPWEENQGWYKEWKLSKGKTKPLIVTGHLRGSIRYVVRKS